MSQSRRAATADQLRSLIGRPSEPDTPLDDYYAGETGERPGEFPYTRGRDVRGYLDELWVMGQYSGFASPKQTNQRFKDLVAAGQTGLSIALDLPTQMGYDSDAPLATGEVGKVGVPLDTVDDLLVVLDGVPLERVRQMRTTANAIGPIFAAFLLEALAEMDVDPRRFRLILQNDPLKEYIARGTYIFPPAAAQKLAVDVIEYFADNLPHWEPIEFCGYHIRDAGGTAVHEVAIATSNGIAYLDAARERGVDIDAIAHSLFLFLSAGVDIFEEAAKLRAARRIWAKILAERYGVARERAAINLFVYTLGGALTAQQPLNNVVRVTCEALAAVLGGAQTLATSSYDEALGLPSPEAAALALRTQQIVAHESGAASVVDPLGGSFYLEELTDRLEAAILTNAADIADRGGSAEAIASGHLHRALADAAYEHQRAVEEGRKPVVGVNVHLTGERNELRGVFRVDPAIEAEQRALLAERRGKRDGEAVAAALAGVTAAARAEENVIPALRAAARARATMGDVTQALEAVYGRFTPAHTY
jgi:methylmalonyl-CoA mutase N-terminal domain/subunit